MSVLVQRASSGSTAHSVIEVAGDNGKKFVTYRKVTTVWFEDQDGQWKTLVRLVWF